MRLSGGFLFLLLWVFLGFVSNLSRAADDPHPEPKYVPAFLAAKKVFEKGLTPSEQMLLSSWNCLNAHPIKEAAPPSEVRFLKQEGELRMTVSSTNEDDEVSFDNYGPFVSGLQGWTGNINEEIGLRAAIKMDAAKKYLIIESAADERAKDTVGFQKEFKAVSDPKSWVMVYSVCSPSE